MGLSGGGDLTYENRDFLFPHGERHDSAAVLVDNGRVVAGIEEERLNRIKHTNKGAVSAIKFCLNAHGARLNDLDQLIIGGDESFLAKMGRYRDFRRIHEAPISNPRGLLHELLQQEMDDDILDSKIHFVHHHLAHAISAYAQSGYADSLIFTMDGGGDDCTGMVIDAAGASLQLLRKIMRPKSLGVFYVNAIRFLGYDLFDEYKVMGLAPYGDPSTYRDLFASFYELLPDGDYVLKADFPDDLMAVGLPRKEKDSLTQAHKDLAAALQEALERIVFHLVEHFQKTTGKQRLCLAGGVAHNCTLNGKLLYSGMFKEIFVQPASHDAGLAIGAALQPFLAESASPAVALSAIDNVFWGSDIDDTENLRGLLTSWNDFLEFHRVENISQHCAELLAAGSVIGWMQGRSEFGPRALGNRSILADPRPAENKDIINAMVKKREAYRPFAPAILEEYASEYFDLPKSSAHFDFMTFVVKVREDKRDVLKATTHVDGTARIQTVSRKSNPKFWELINAFREKTGIPVLLNTSFNNNAEPIVDSAEDAIVCFLTTRLHYLVIGDYLISKRDYDKRACLELAPSLPHYSRLAHTKRFISSDHMIDLFEITSTFSSRYNVSISSGLFNLLLLADGSRSVSDMLGDDKTADEANKLAEELFDLWGRRVIKLKHKRLKSEKE
jgi:carbamoyltransferase